MTNLLVNKLFSEDYTTLNIEAAKELLFWEDGTPEEEVLQLVYSLVGKTDLSGETAFLEEHAEKMPIQLILQNSKITDKLVRVKQINEQLVQSLVGSALSNPDTLSDMVMYIKNNLEDADILKDMYRETLTIQQAVMESRLKELNEIQDNNEQFDQASDNYTNLLNTLRLANTGVIIQTEVLGSLVQDFPNLFNLPICAYQGEGVELEQLHQADYIRWITQDDLRECRKTIQSEEDQGIISELESIKMFILLSDLETSMAMMNRAALVNMLEMRKDEEEVEVEETIQPVETMTVDK